MAFMYSWVLFPQSESFTGDYYVQLGNREAHFIEYTLTLNEDGTFLFHSYSNNTSGIPQEVDTYGKGTWNSEDNVISFYSDAEKDVDGKHTLNFTDTKARFMTRSVRSISDKPIKTRLKFYTSEIFWIKGIEIFKG